VLVVLFFKLGVEGRGREVGLLRAVGLSPAAVRRLFATEGLFLSLIGSLLGVIGGVGYASLLITLLTTRWVGAVGTTALTLHVSPMALAAGAGGGVAAAVVCIWWTLRRLRRVSERSLLAGEIARVTGDRPPSRWPAMAAPGLGGLGLLLVVLAATAQIDPVAGFFGAGAALLVAALTFAGVVLRRRTGRVIGADRWPIAHLAGRNAAYRPARSVLSMSIIASATFILVTVDAFRRDTGVDPGDRSTGTGGYELMVQMLLPLAHDPNSAEGRDAMNVRDLDRSTMLEPFRVRPGDDASCLNLYQPTNPRIVAPRDSFLAQGRFTFASVAAAGDAERANPWLLLNRVEADGAIPVIADANSMTYVLHRAVGDEFVLTNAGVPVKLRFVAALRDSIFQSELLMSEAHFRRLFPDRAGYQLLLVDTASSSADVAQEIEQGLSDAGADAVLTAEYLASFHQVENTYLSTFQTLGGLGLLLGTVGLATVLLRNVLERRREFALLAAVGYRRSHFIIMAALENMVIVLGGLAAGALCAAIAVAPTVAERGARLPLSSGALLLLFAVFVVALLSSLAAMAAATRTPLLDTLRSE
jgi:putative ABC transport system permease protein